MDAALAEIRHAFGFPAVTFKQSVRRFIRRGAGHSANQARYGARARMFVGWSTVEADAWLACRYASEQRRWRSNDARLSLMVLRELRLIVRFMRAKRLELQPVIADVLGEDRAEAAE
jgi:hypothetical protein